MTESHRLFQASYLKKLFLGNSNARNGLRFTMPGTQIYSFRPHPVVPRDSRAGTRDLVPAVKSPGFHIQEINGLTHKRATQSDGQH